MKKILLLCLVSLILVSCATNKENKESKDVNFGSNTPLSVQYNYIFDIYNSYGVSAAMGISGPYRNKNDAVTAATKECLQYLSFRNGLAMQMDASTIVNTAEDELSFDSFIFGGTSDRIYEETAEQMEIKEVVWCDGNVGSLVIASIPGMEKLNWKGDWTKKTPEIEGWNVAVGCSFATYTNMLKAIEASTFRAAQELLSIDARALMVDNTIVETKTNEYKNDSFSINGIRFEGFTVLAYAYNEKDGKVYAMVASKKK